MCRRAGSPRAGRLRASPCSAWWRAVETSALREFFLGCKRNGSKSLQTSTSQLNLSRFRYATYVVKGAHVGPKSGWMVQPPCDLPHSFATSDLQRSGLSKTTTCEHFPRGPNPHAPRRTRLCLRRHAAAPGRRRAPPAPRGPPPRRRPGRTAGPTPGVRG